MEWDDFELNIGRNLIKGKKFLPPKNYKNALGLVILCHGIPGGKKDPGDPGYPHLAKTLSGLGFKTVMFNFRGAGESTGDFDILGWAEDLKGVLGYMVPASHCSAPLVLFGFSAGAAVAVYISAQDNRITGLILCGCPAYFDSILSENGAEQFLNRTREIGIIKSPDFPPNLTEWKKGFQVIRPENWISQIKSKAKLIIHGDNDEVVPVDHALRLYEKALEPKDLIVIKNGDHRLRLNEEAMKVSLEWLKLSILS